MGDSPPDLDTLLAGLEDLLAKQDDEREDDPGEGNFRCEACNACYNCRFCVGCDSCEDCTYCEDCVECVSVTQSKRCVACTKGSYLEDCRGCEGSRYLALCIDCKDCTYCLGCVGLEGAEYHVLNQKVTKKEFYKALNRMREDLDSRVEKGWRPEIIGLVSVELDEEEPEEEADVEERDDEAEAFMRRPSRVDETEVSPEPKAERVAKAVSASPQSQEVDPRERSAKSPAKADEGEDQFEHELTPVRFEPPSSSRGPDEEASSLWDDAPAVRRGSRAGSSLSRGRRPPPSEREASSLWADEPSRRGVPPRAERSTKTGTGTGSATGNTSVRIGRRPSKAREVTSSVAPWIKAESDAPLPRHDVDDEVDPFGEQSMGLGAVEPSRPEPQAARPRPAESSAPQRGGGLRRGRRPARKP